jgi:hypothetical protein
MRYKFWHDHCIIVSNNNNETLEKKMDTMTKLPFLITLNAIEFAIEAVNSKILYGSVDSVTERENQIEALEELKHFKKCWQADLDKLEGKTA